MFGVDNTGVINQRQSPAIWQSNIADFPANYILGRILIDTFQGGIYIDTASTRLQISNGTKNAINGLQDYGGIPTNINFGLGGDLNYSTVIDVNGNDIVFGGAVDNVQIDSDGYLNCPAQSAYYLPANVVGLSPIIQNATILFIDQHNGVTLKVAAQTI